jgi:hypothetical protein
VLARYVDHGHHIIRRLRRRHCRGMLVDRQVPGLTGLVPAGILRPNCPVSQTGLELFQGGSNGRASQEADTSRTRVSAPYVRPSEVA